MFEDENERKVNDQTGYTPENSTEETQPAAQPVPTEYQSQEVPEAPVQNYTEPEPEAPARNYTESEPEAPARNYTEPEPAAPAAPAYTPYQSEQSFTPAEEPVNNYGNAETYQSQPAYGNVSNNVYSGPQAEPQIPVNNQAPVYSENPYSPYSDRPYENNNSYQQQAPAFNPPVPPVNNGNGTGSGNGKKSNKKTKKIILAVLAVILVFAIGFGSASIIFGKSKKSSYRSDNSEDASESGSISSGTGDDTDLEIKSAPSSSTSSTAEIAKKARLSNVGILIYTNSSSTSASGEGSGIVMSVDSTGEYTYIITCAHVIDTTGATIKVETEDGTTYDAEVVGYDTRTDIGVVRVKSTDFTCAEFGDSDELAVGDPVYAVGNPGGVEFFGTFTAGYVSAINRPVSSEIGYTMKCIQHDAAINPGNSGGMLVNQYGQVIGINSQKITSTSYEGMGFAIPITDAKPIIEDLITYGYVPDRAKLGITYYSASSVTQYAIIAQANGLPSGTLVIESISSDSSFSGTDVRRGDMIIAVGGKKLDTADALLEQIDNGKVGDKLTLTIARVDSSYKVSTFDVTVTLVEDKGTEVQEQTTQQSYNPYSFFGY